MCFQFGSFFIKFFSKIRTSWKTNRSYQVLAYKRYNCVFEQNETQAKERKISLRTPETFRNDWNMWPSWLENWKCKTKYEEAAQNVQTPGVPPTTPVCEYSEFLACCSSANEFPSFTNFTFSYIQGNIWFPCLSDILVSGVQKACWSWCSLKGKIILLY